MFPRITFTDTAMNSQFQVELRKVDDGERTIEAIRGVVGKRLSYKPSEAGEFELRERQRLSSRGKSE